MSELALQLIAENKRTRAKRLDLGRCGLTTVPDEIGELIWLEELVLGNHYWDNYSADWLDSKNRGKENRLDELPEMLRHLTSLKTLFLNGASGKKWKLYDLSPLSGLISLQALNCYSTLVRDLSPLSGLINLQSLDCSHTEVSDLSPLSGLTSLQSLYCSSTEISDLSPLSGLISLKSFSCSRTEVNDLLPLNGLIYLHLLHCFSTEVRDLSPLSGLTNLQSLDCSHTEVSDLSPLSGLTSLQSLYCINTEVSDLLPLRGLNSLQSLYCIGTKVRKLKPISNLPSLHAFGFINCHIDDCPADVWQSGDGAQLRSFFLGKQREAEAPTKPRRRKQLPQFDGRRDVKLILLGNSAAGKTNLVHWLTKGEFLGNRRSTHGLEVRRWLPDAARFPALAHLAVNIWDFGGQEYYHGAYRLFMSANAAYLLLWCRDTDINGRRDTVLLDGTPAVPLEHFEKRYWLDTVRHYGRLTTAPLLLVQNKTDAPDGDRRRLSQELHEAYGIHDSFHVSLLQGCSPDYPRQQRLLNHFAAELAEALVAAADKTEDVADWQKIRDCVLELREDGGHKENPFVKYLQEEIWVSLDDFKKACGELLERPLTQDAVNEVYTLPRLLDKGGAVVFFPNNARLSDRLFLRPDRLAEQIYDVLNHTVLKKSGEFSAADLNTVKPAMRPIFLEIAQQLGLIFPHPIRGTGHYLAPQYLPETYPIEDLFEIAAHGAWQGGFWLRVPLFFYRKLLHDLLLHFAANLQTESRYFWKHGIVFLKNGLRVLIKGLYPSEDEHEGTLLIGVEKTDGPQQAALQKEIFQTCLHLLRGEDHEEKQTGLLTEPTGPTAKGKGKKRGSMAEPTQPDDRASEREFDYTHPLGERLLVSHDGKRFVAYDALVAAAKNDEVKLFLPGDGEPLLLRRFTPLLPKEPARAKRVFLSYSHQNTPWLGRLRTHLAGLRRAKEIEDWSDQEILPGDLWDTTIKEKMAAADVFILLLSADFIASEYIWNHELKHAFDAFNERKASVIPVLFEPLDLGGLPEVTQESEDKSLKIGTFEVVPKDDDGRLRAVSLWTNTEEALARVAKRIREAVQQK